MSPIDLPQFKLRSMEEPQVGPSLDLVVSKERFELVMDGLMTLYDRETGLLASIKEDGLHIVAKDSLSLLGEEAYQFDIDVTVIPKEDIRVKSNLVISDHIKEMIHS